MPQASNKTPSNNIIKPKNRIKSSKNPRKTKRLGTLSKTCHNTSHESEMITEKTEDQIVDYNFHLISLLDEVVYEWFQRAQRLVETGPITNEMFLQKFSEFKQIFGISNIVTNYEWIWSFRKKYNITNLDMTMLRIENDNKPLSVDNNDIVLFVLQNDPIRKYFTIVSLEEDNTTESTAEMSPRSPRLDYNNNINENIVSDDSNNLSKPKLDVLNVITNDEEARRHLKPLEDYVLLRENFRAIGLISQLEEIFNSKTDK